MAFETEQVRLSMRSPETGDYLTATVYTVDGIEDIYGNPRQLSIGQLVMAICLQRATYLEDEIIKKMSAMNNSARMLELISDIEAKMADLLAEDPTGNVFASFSSLGIEDETPYREFAAEQGISYTAGNWVSFLEACGVEVVACKTDIATGTTYVDAESAENQMGYMETKMDELNTMNQSDLIELQSLTNKRDQSYELITAMLKSFNTVQNSILGNLR